MVSAIEATSPPVPRHVAIIMDGNGRWARARHLPRTAGHKRGVEAARRAIEACAQRGVEALTLFAFSSENWKRPDEEVSSLMQLFVTALEREVPRLMANDIQLRFIGAREAFPVRLQQRIAEAETRTAGATGLKVVVAANYGGRWDIAQAARHLAERVQNGELTLDAVTPEALDQALSTAGLPDPDLFIRTGGEHRMSNFLLWQMAYAELYFTDVLWPDFEACHLEAAIAAFSGRERRFGMTGDQVSEASHA
ncbi:MAG TPA: isoprenyl transferase [Thioalkalivibrio sp.]|nr:isoprenyl transferase [Thioalkalivibrio sp.]